MISPEHTLLHPNHLALDRLGLGIFALVKEGAAAALRIIGNRNEAAAIEKLILYLISPKDIIVARQKANAKYAQIRADVELAKSCVLAHTQYYT
jgi:hypothetical protein